MTSENNKFESFYKPLRDYNASDDCDSPIDLLGYDLCNERASAKDLADAAGYLITALTERRPSEWLSFDVYRCEDSGEFRAEIAITLGGPTVTLDYESGSDSLEFTYHFGTAVVSTLVSTEPYTAGADMAELIKEHAAAY